MTKSEPQEQWIKECCSLELAKKLREIGIKQQSLFWWLSGGVPEKWYLHSDGCYSKAYHPENVSAFTASELLNMTPQWIDSGVDEPFNNFSFNLDIRRIYVNEKLIRIYAINYVCDTVQLASGTPNFANKLFAHQIMDEKPADAFAKNIIHLHENNFLTIGK